jgi:hypothetical protein
MACLLAMAVIPARAQRGGGMGGGARPMGGGMGGGARPMGGGMGMGGAQPGMGGAPGGQGAGQQSNAAYNPPPPASTQADVTIVAQLTGSPEPTTYIWSGDRQDPTDTSTYYHFYYTGTVQPDARINASDKIERIAIRLNDWEKQKKWIIAKLTNYYQVANNIQPSALDFFKQGARGGEQGMEASIKSGLGPGAAASAQGLQGAGTAQGAAVLSGIQMQPVGAAAPAGPNAAAPNVAPVAAGFDAKAAAEWTFYYDQLVLWEYYCSRMVLNDSTDALLESSQGSTPAGAGQAGAGQAGAGMGAGPNAGGMGAGMGAGAPGIGAPGASTVREVFQPFSEYANPDYNQQYRQKFVDAANASEQKVYRAFLDMLNSIDTRADNREKYDQWVKDHQQQVADYAENWRKLRDGETVVLGKSVFLITPEKMESAPLDTMNLLRTERLTPQDLINPDGTVKQPEKR